MITFKQLFSGCWFRCDEVIFDRNRQGQLVFRCERCGEEKKVLPGLKYKARKTKKKTLRLATNAHGGRCDLGTSQPVSFARRK